MLSPIPFAALRATVVSHFASLPLVNLNSHSHHPHRPSHLLRCSQSAACSLEVSQSTDRNGEALAAGSNGGIAMEYAEIGLVDKVCDEVGHVRIRPHVNPLNPVFTVPVEVPDWNKMFKDAELPLMVDISYG